MPLWLVIVLWAWWERLARELDGTGIATLAVGGVPMAAHLALGARALGWIGEALFYTLAWRAVGARMPVLRLAAALVSFSLFDLVALGVRDVRGWAGSPLVSVIAGGVVAPGEGPAALALAGFGLCAVARMVCTAHAQARALGRGLAAPLALTSATHAAARAALTLAVTWAHGRSPM